MLEQPERTRLLSVAIDLPNDGSARRGHPWFKVMGIEDLIVRQTRDHLQRRSPPSQVSAQLHALTELALAGVGGRLHAAYLERRLALETRGEVVLQLPPADAGEFLGSGPRATSLSEMAAILAQWHHQCGWPQGTPVAAPAAGSGMQDGSMPNTELRPRRTTHCEIIPFTAGCPIWLSKR